MSLCACVRVVCVCVCVGGWVCVWVGVCVCVCGVKQHHIPKLFVLICRKVAVYYLFFHIPYNYILQ